MISARCKTLPLFQLCYTLAACCHRATVHALRSQTSTAIRSSWRWTGGRSASSSFLSDSLVIAASTRRPLRRGVFRRSRRAVGVGGISMVQGGNDDEASKVKMRLRAEAEAPFRKVRIFVFSSFVISATIGLLVSTSSLLALTQNINQGQSFDELLANIAIDISAIGVSTFLIKRDLAAQSGRLARMEIGAKLAGLKVRLQLPDDSDTVTLSALRRDRGRDKRVAVLVGGAEAVKKSLDSAIPFSEALGTSDILIVPLVLEAAPGRADSFRASGGENDMGSAVGRPHVGMPVALNRWQEYIDSEVETAVSQGIDPLEDGFSLVLKKNGRIGARSKGCPPWGTLVGDVERRKEAGMDVSNI